ncbi:transposase [Nocardia sp. 004]|uniref:transposase n=1 Tax=Nocardia sp. 004 TaxID=3385978 RepID=UPI0039A03D6E
MAVGSIPEREGRPPEWSKWRLIDGIRWRPRVGAPWRDMPERCCRGYSTRSRRHVRNLVGLRYARSWCEQTRPTVP